MDDFQEYLGDNYVLYDNHYRVRADDDYDDITALPSLFRIIFVLGLRIGFILIQVGRIPIENVYMIIYHNILEIALSTLSYGTIGVLVSFGAGNSVLGWKSDSTPNNATGFSAVLTGTAQMSTFLVGRIHTVGAIVLTVLYCALYQPLLMRWIWDKDGWMSPIQNIMRDHCGALVIHVPSTLVGLVGSLFLGRRLVPVKNVDEFSLSNENAGGTLMGYILVILGYFALTFPQVGYRTCDRDNCLIWILMNNMMAIGTGILVASLLNYLAYKGTLKYWIILRCIQGGMSGMISVSAGIGIYSPWQVYLMATLGSILFFFMTLISHNTALEDTCNMAASHLVSGLLGAILWPLFYGIYGMDFIWQLLYTLIIVILTILFAVIVFVILKFAGILRNDYEIKNHEMAENVEFNLPKRGFVERLVPINDVKSPHILPGSYRQRFISGNGVEQKEKNRVLQDVTNKPAVKNKERTENVKNMAATKEEAKIFTVPVAEPRIVSGIGSGDFYDCFI